jgi:ElaB/YqjD/DUF883 family membrane-anchored ribosome-binding protein
LLNTAEKAVDTTRGYANDALDKAESKVRDLRGSVDPVVDMLASKAQRLARQSLDIASEAKERAQRSLSNAPAATTRYVSDQPLRSVLIAAAVGAGIALLVSSARHRRTRTATDLPLKLPPLLTIAPHAPSPLLHHRATARPGRGPSVGLCRAVPGRGVERGRRIVARAVAWVVAVLRRWCFWAWRERP